MKCYVNDAIKAASTAENDEEMARALLNTLREGLNYYSGLIPKSFVKSDMALMIYTLRHYLAGLEQEQDEKCKDTLEILDENFGTYVISATVPMKKKEGGNE